MSNKKKRVETIAEDIRKFRHRECRMNHLISSSNVQSSLTVSQDSQAQSGSIGNSICIRERESEIHRCWSHIRCSERALQCSSFTHRSGIRSPANTHPSLSPQLSRELLSCNKNLLNFFFSSNSFFASQAREEVRSGSLFFPSYFLSHARASSSRRQIKSKKRKNGFSTRVRWVSRAERRDVERRQAKSHNFFFSYIYIRRPKSGRAKQHM